MRHGRRRWRRVFHHNFMGVSGVFRDRTGDQYGRLTVIGLSTRLERRSNGIYNRFWNCLCDCGNTVEVCSGNLPSGHTQSCGCFKAERIHEGTYKHGLIHTSEYWAWSSMRRRCYDTNDKGYKNYGARGITVCDRWIESFENFISDMGMKPSPKHSVERKNNDSGYSPENCIWGTRAQQNSNRRNTRKLEHDGKNLTLMEWSQITGIKYFTLVRRVNKGWSPSDVIGRPVR